ncbi:uncharacterized protein LOC121726315 isoform X2 [Aricia agestis]|uniref:uncharacterized protein LOC121726315 isoform X2 n=1 Tax=Aricia agestis TaxID=91739 RepID=UPI001C20A204|nr:uncharacterized protein LOC121726315 isoform X2 [Aricia agestis]
MSINKNNSKESSNHCKKEIEEKKFAKTVNLNKDEAIYLWNSLEEILTKSLLDVAKRQPENPIHSLAHSLIYYKYHKKSKDTPNLAEGLVPRREAVFKTIKTPQVEQQKTTSVDEDQEILAFTTNIAQQIIFSLLEQ